MLDIIVIIAMLLAFYIGYRRGFIVSLIHLVGIYLATLLAPAIAEPIGSIFMGDSKYLAFVAGFFLVVAAAIFILWFVAPIIGKLILLNPFKRFDKLLGGVLNLVVVLVVTAGLFAAFDYANISNEPDVEKISAYVDEKIEDGEGVSKEDVLALANGDITTMRMFFKSRFVDYETLDKSTFFNSLASFGRAIAPSLDGLNELVRNEAKAGIKSEMFLD